jgi:protein-S-isoprenylcysteine O-methyltransferase Ste14
MALSYLLLIISILWILSEIILSRMTYSHSEQAKILDRSSLPFLWITIVVSTTLGIFAGTTGVGFISYRTVIISHIGIVLILLGLIIRWWAILFLRSYFTANVSIQNDHQLIKGGMYQYVRHPSYAGSLLSFFGLGIAFSNWFVTIIIFFPILFAFLQRIKIEEEVLRKHFGEAYNQYSKNTSRLIPKIY